MPDSSNSSTDLDRFLDKVPEPDEVRRKITENLRQAKLLKQILRISEQRERVKEVSSCK